MVKRMTKFTTIYVFQKQVEKHMKLCTNGNYNYNWEDNEYKYEITLIKRIK